MAQTLVRLILAALLALAAAPAFAEPLPRADAPSWILPREVPEPSESESEFTGGGFEILLWDVQVHVEPVGHVRYVRSVLSVADRVGLEEAGVVDLTVDPDGEALTLHHLRVHRAGDVIDHSDLSFARLRREEDLSEGVITGEITLHAAIPDLRVGDIVDLAFSKKVSPSIFPEEFYYALAAEPYAEVRAEHYRILTPADKTLSIGGSVGYSPRITITDGHTEFNWVRINALPSDDKLEDGRSETFPLVELSSFTDWSMVVEGLAPHYRSRSDLPEELMQFVAATMKTETDEDRRATAAFRLVQDRIRYVAITLGDGGYVPRAPDLVWRRGYGDCKDKSLLLISILARMGIEADVVLVNSKRGRSLNERKASPYAFNHAIVRVRSADGDYFMDPTDTLQGGVGRTIATSDFGFGLPLSDGEEELISVRLAPPQEPGQEVRDIYTFKTEGRFGAELRVLTVFRREEADDMRSRLRGETLASRGDEYRDWYDDRFPGIEIVAPLTAEDDLDANVLTLNEHYQIPRTAFAEKNLWRRFWLTPHAVRHELQELDDEPLESEMKLDSMFFQRHSVTLENLPHPLKAPAEINHVAKHLTFSRKGEADPSGKWLNMTWELRINEPVVLPEDEKEYRDAVDLVDRRDNLRYNLVWKGAGAEFGDRIVVAGLNVRGALSISAFVLLSLVAGLGVRRGLSQS